uniref:Mitochondrial rRNA methyltransferase 3 n=1 Tax=Cyanistes caeruleus TaxID=156563 RepID=A0A8C0UU74_CYACU
MTLNTLSLDIALLENKFSLPSDKLCSNLPLGGAFPNTFSSTSLERFGPTLSDQASPWGGSVINLSLFISSGIFSKPDPAKMSYPAAQLASSLPLLLICDNIRDPGNLGTILRSAAGAGCEKVLLTKGCVDPWEPKVLRAGMGAHFRVPIITNLDWESVPTNLPAGIQVCVADNNPSAPAGTTSVPRGADRAGSAPTSPKAPVKSSPQDLMLQSPEHEDEEGAAGIPELAAQHYYEDWARAPVAVVIGGETHGLSPAALRLAASTGGKRLVIPVVPGVDSLNSAIAAGIMLFEGKRQLLWRHKQEDDRHKLPVPG